MEAYLKAAEKAARQHPYPGVPGASSLPALADVYVRQQARAPAADNQDSLAVPATEVFGEDRAMCVLLGAPGGGKSTLLRAHLADCADGWLHGTTGKTIPVMVNAGALTGTDPLPTALAKTTTGGLRQVGLLDELGADFFRRPPRAGVSWLVLVDGLDEIPNADARSTVLTMLDGAAAAAPGLYKFVIATRPLPAKELGTLGRHVPRYELQPFSRDDLLTYATHWFRALDDPGRHAGAFMAGLRRSSLEVLARTPLMAFMLCQLYAADPARPLPEGRTGAYESFVELIYEQNSHKQVANTHDKAVRELKDRYQIPRDIESAEEAAQRVRRHLPELIGYLAYQRINGSTAPAVAIVASHPQASRPQKAKEDLWNSFLTDLLRPTGILTQRGDDFDFLHQTLLEYHAACHATRDEHARNQVLGYLFPFHHTGTAGRLELPKLESSYLSFLIDRLLTPLSPGDPTTRETILALEHFTAHGEAAAYNFLVGQIDLRTNIPPHIAVRKLTAVATDSSKDGGVRRRAVEALDVLGGHREEVARLYAIIAADPTENATYRMSAATILAGLDGHREEAARLLATVAADPTSNYGLDAVASAAVLAGLDGHLEEGAELLIAFATDPTLSDHCRVDAGEALAGVDRYRDQAAELLAHLANNPALNDFYRRRAADRLAGLGGHREEGAGLLIAFATDPAVDDSSRWQAAYDLVRLGEKRAAGLLARLATDPTLDDAYRVRAGSVLAGEGGQREEGVELLIRLADDITIHGQSRLQAAEDLARIDSKAGMTRVARLADDTTLDGGSRLQAAFSLVRAAEEAGKAHLARLEDGSPVWAGRALAQADREAGAIHLARLAGDTTLDGGSRLQAAWFLAEVDREAGVAQLARLADDTTVDDGSREWAARARNVFSREAGGR